MFFFSSDTCTNQRLCMYSVFSTATAVTAGHVWSGKLHHQHYRIPKYLLGMLDLLFLQ